MDNNNNRNRLLNQAYREYNDSLLFLMQSISNIISTHSDTQNTYNNNIRSLITLLQSTSLNMENNHNSLLDNIRAEYPFVSPLRQRQTQTISRNTEPVFNNNNNTPLFTPRIPTRRRYNQNTPLLTTPVSPTRLRLSREFLNDNNVNQFDTLTDMMNTMQIHFQSSVPVYPTLRQIQIATRCYNYTSEELEEEPDIRCPITREEFNVGEEICMIRHCRHKFKKEPLYQWFNSNVRCPVCRFDIREHLERDNEEDEVYSEIDISSNVDVSMNISTVILTEALRDAIREVEPNNVVSLELPIPINRTNSGTLSDFFRDLSNNVI